MTVSEKEKGRTRHFSIDFLVAVLQSGQFFLCSYTTACLGLERDISSIDHNGQWYIRVVELVGRKERRGNGKK